MKNIKVFFAILFNIIYFILPTNAQQRNLVMIHGLGGSEGALKGYQNLFSALGPYTGNFTHYRQFGNIVNFSHQTDVSVVQTAQNARIGTINASPNRSDRSRDIAIGHSMGGLTVREMDRFGIANSSKLFGGFITLGGPHFGTKLPASFQNGSINAFVTEGCKEVALDPIVAVATTIFPEIQPILNVTDILGLDNNFICNIISMEKIAEVPDFQSQSINDFKLDAPYLNGANGINLFSSTTHKIALIGNENSPVHWRLISSDEFNDAVEGGLGSGTKDEDLVDIMDAIEITGYVSGTVCGVLGFVCMADVSQWIYIPGLFNCAFEFFQGSIWLANSESKYNELLGAHEVIYRPLEQRYLTPYCQGRVWYYESLMYSLPFGTQAYWAAFSARTTYTNDPTCWNSSVSLMPVSLNGQSDGAVSVEGQKLPEGSVSGGAELINHTIDGVNHFELRDHPEVTARFELIFTGALGNNPQGVNSFFYVPQ
jgi:hypothetical protein